MRSLLLLALVTTVGAAAATAAPEDPPKPAPAPAGAVYKNDPLGLRLEGPPGWTLVADKGGVTTWTRLATWSDKTTDVEAVLSARERKAASLAALEETVKKEWATDPTFTVTTTQVVQPTALKPVGMLLLEATQVRKPTPKPGEPPSAPVIWQVNAAYVLGAGHEYLLYAQGRATVWSRVRGKLDALRDSITLSASPRGAEGEGAYRDDRRGFTCRYPRGYAVVVPQRPEHVVEFQGVGADDAVLGVYHIKFAEAVERDAERVVAYYAEEQHGEASSAPFEVGGRPGMLVTARASVGGAEQTVFLAVVKRGADEVFRLKAAMPRAQEARGRSAFDALVRSFVLGPAPR
jgi:hypothetical protein